MWQTEKWTLKKLPGTNDIYTLILNGEEGEEKILLDQAELNDLKNLIRELGGSTGCGC